jgi:ABC-2 type transport system permease protein
VIGRAGSIVWLLHNEVRLGWRDVFARRGSRRGLIVAVILVTVFTVMGVATGLALRHVRLPVSPLPAMIADLAALAVFSLMLSQTLAQASQALYSRGDLDLLFSSPIAARKVLAVRFAAIAFNVFGAFALMVGPFLIPVALIGHPTWLAALVVLASLALAASAIGLLLAVALFRLIGPRRTRTVAQVMAAMIGAAFFLAGQAGNILGGRRFSVWSAAVTAAMRHDFRMPPAGYWVLRAALGEPLPLLGAAGGALALFAAVSQGLGARFAADSSAAAGADQGGRVKARAGEIRFAAGAFAATVGKELRLLRRDAALLSQVFLRVLYLLPLAFVLIQRAHDKVSYLLPGGAAGLVLMAGQVAGSLTWITISAEDAPDLLAASPAPIGALLRAKLAAALTPVAVLLAIPLVVLIVIAPVVGLAATAGCAASSIASGLINAWYNKPGKRADFRRRRGGTLVGAIAQIFVTMLIAAATGAATMPAPFWWFAPIPAVLAVVALLLLRRTDEQVAASLRALSSP